MVRVAHIVLAISLNIIKDVTCVEYFSEKAWMDSRGRDKFFDYAEIAEPNSYYQNTNGRVINYSSNVDSELFYVTQKAEAVKAPSTSSNSIVSLFLNTIRNVVQPQQTKSHHYSSKETSKGLDIKLDSSFLPNFGNNKDTKFTVAGTKWCGAGDSAKDKNDIGYFYLTDSCCRMHDLCPSSIAAQESKYGLINSGKFTRSHCHCDHQFHQCLKNVNSMLSYQVGTFYFNVLGHQCFKEEHPVISCKNSIKSKCVEYETDKTKSKTYQWFDNPWY